jgi:hypothetical protein
MGMNLKPQMLTAKTKEPSTSVDHLLMFGDVPEAAAFVEKFKELPYNVENPGTNQLEELMKYEQYSKYVININKERKKEENVKDFLTNAFHTLNTELNKYSPTYLKQAIEAWIYWENSQKGYKLAIEFQKTTEITPENCLEVIRKAKEIVIRRSNVVIEDDMGDDFMDPESHRPISPESYVNSGYQMLNTMLTEKPSSAFEPGTLTIFVGESNIGKTIILGNIASNIFISGTNVLLISLEMATWKLYKRIGANVFDVPMDQYEDFASSQDRVSEKILELKKKMSAEAIPLGEFRSRRFATATPDDIESYALNLEEKLGLKWGAIVIDYLTEITSNYGISPTEMYQLHKQNTNDLWAMGVRNKWAMVTAHQLKIAGYGAKDLNLSMLGESSGIIHRTDSIIGLIQSPEMKLEKKYFMKGLKLRDSMYKNYYAEFSIDYNRMRLTDNGKLYEPTEFLF